MDCRCSFLPATNLLVSNKGASPSLNSSEYRPHPAGLVDLTVYYDGRLMRTCELGVANSESWEREALPCKDRRHHDDAWNNIRGAFLYIRSAQRALYFHLFSPKPVFNARLPLPSSAQKRLAFQSQSYKSSASPSPTELRFMEGSSPRWGH